MDIIKIGIDIIQALIFSIFSFVFIRKKISYSNYVVLMILFFALAFEILWFDYNVIYEGFSSILYSITIFIMLKPIMIGRNLELIILALILNIIISVGNGIALSIITFVMNYTMMQFVNSTSLQVIGGIISTFSIAFISLIILKSRKQLLNILTPYSSYFLGIMILLYISITFLEKLLFSQKYNEYIILLTWFSFLSLFSLFLILMFKQAKDNSMRINQASISKELELIQDKFTRYEQYNKKLSTIRHDLTRTFFILKNYIMTSNEDKALEVLDELLKETSIAPRLVITGNNLIDAVISSKAIDCADSNIEFSYKIDPSYIIYFREFDVALLLLNILSNAIENIDESKKGITLSMQNKDDMLIIKVTNTVSLDILESNPRLETTKIDKESHGFGILSMKNIAKKYDGEVMFQQDQMIFSCMILLPIPFDYNR